MAAGLGFKTFTTGEVLTASDTNGYLMQGVLVFASSAARSAAITSPQEGQYSYLKDTNSTEYYDGAAWIAAPIGDITGVTAGTGISGGGTSGTVTITNSMATEITAKGDLIAGTGSATFDNLPVGSNNQTILADSTATTGLKYANGSIATLTTTGDTLYASAANTLARRAIGSTGQVLTVSGGVPTWATPAGGGGGKVLQVVQGTTATTATMSSSTPADTNLTATITPTLSTSKILIICTQEYYFNKNSSSPQVGLRIMRDATSIINWGSYGAFNLGTGATNTDGRILQGFSYLDSPATTSAITYKTQGSTNNTTTITFQETGTSTIILMEIGA